MSFGKIDDTIYGYVALYRLAYGGKRISQSIWPSASAELTRGVSQIIYKMDSLLVSENKFPYQDKIANLLFLALKVKDAHPVGNPKY